MQGKALIAKYFSGLDAGQLSQLEHLQDLYHYWNTRINVISRKSMDQLYLRHVLPSLAFGRIIHFAAQSHIIDVGTGGGFPGIPMAIMFPQVQFFLIDSVGKKIKVVKDIIRELELQNAAADQVYSKEHKQTYDFVVGRAVKPFNEFYRLTRHLVHQKHQNPLPNGFLYVSGGGLDQEMKGFQGYRVYPLHQFIEEGIPGDKKIVYYPA